MDDPAIKKVVSIITELYENNVPPLNESYTLTQYETFFSCIMRVYQKDYSGRNPATVMIKTLECIPDDIDTTVLEKNLLKTLNDMGWKPPTFWKDYWYKLMINLAEGLSQYEDEDWILEAQKVVNNL